MARPKAVRTETPSTTKVWSIKISPDIHAKLTAKANELGMTMQSLGDEVVESVLNNRIETRVVRKLDKSVAALIDDQVRLQAFMKFEQSQQQSTKKGAA